MSLNLLTPENRRLARMIGGDLASEPVGWELTVGLWLRRPTSDEIDCLSFRRTAHGIEWSLHGPNVDWFAVPWQSLAFDAPDASTRPMLLAVVNRVYDGYFTSPGSAMLTAEFVEEVVVATKIHLLST